MSLYSNLLTVLTPYANKIKQNEIDIRTAMSLSGGAPIVVASTSAMTDTNQIYVLSTDGHWYYHNGSAWVAGGEYGGVATDTTLTQPGMAADSKSVGDVVNPMRTATASDVGKALKAKTVANGKVTEWEFGEAGGADPETIEQAVTDWLDEHPGAVTTVEDGSITWVKLNSDVQNTINSKAPIINASSQSEYNHVFDGTLKNVELIGGANSVGNVKIANKLNLFPLANAIKTDSNATFSVYDYTGYINGVISAATNALIPLSGVSVNIPAGQYKFILTYDITGATITAWNKLNPKLSVLYENSESYTQVVNQYVTTIDTNTLVVPLSLEHDVTKLTLQFSLANGSTYSNARFYYGLYPADVEITDTGIVLANGQSVDYTSSLSAYASGVICTMQNRSIITYEADTKTYIDNHIPADVITDADLKYITPEMYGAVGDGVTDDSTAINNCIQASVTLKVPVKGFGTYRINSPILLDADSVDLFLNEIVAIDSISAVILSRQFCQFEFNFISNASVAIELTGIANRNNINGVRIESVNSGIRFSPSNSGISYNVFTINSIYVSSGNAIEGPTCTHDHTQTNPDILQQENYFYNCKLRCANGWGIYNSPGRYFSIDMEANVKNGIHMDGGMYTFVGCRYSELVNKAVDADETNGGLLVKFLRGSLDFVGGRKIPYKAIDVSEAPDFDDCSTEVKSSLMWLGAYVDAPIYTKNFITLGNKVILLGNKKICVPMHNTQQTISADYDMRNSDVAYLTRMNITVPNCTIHLSDSYCSLGYKTFTVDQSTSGNYCTIFSSRDDVNPIFDGQTLGTGVYEVTAECTLDSGISGTNNYYDGCTGENDVWTVTKLS